MDDANLLNLLAKLEVVPADALEHQTLDFKEWDRRGMNMAVEAVIGHVVCMANGGGGCLVIGVNDKKIGRSEAILGVPAEVDVNVLRKSIYERTRPQIMPSIDAFSVPEGTGRLLLIDVQGEFPPYTDSQGRARIRVDRECLPLDGHRLQGLIAARSNIDATSKEVEGNLSELLSPAALEALRSMAAKDAPEELLVLSDEELLRSLNLITDRERLKAAGLLLVGKASAIERTFPSYQWSFLKMSGSTEYENVIRESTSLATAIQKLETLITPLNPITTVDQGLLHLEFRRYPTLAIREALMNAFGHANYRIPGVIQIQFSDDKLEILNPGGFIGGITASNFLRHVPVARNATLMNALISLRLANRNNLGMKRMYRSMLLEGKEPPVITDIGEAVRVVFLASDFSAPFRAFAERRMLEGFRLSLEHLLILQYILRHGEIDLSTAAEICQQTEKEARESLRQLIGAGTLEVLRRDGHGYWVLSVQTARQLKGAEVDAEAAPLSKFQIAHTQISAALEARSGGIKSHEIRQITGLSATDVKYVLRTMSAKKSIISLGRGPAAVWYLYGDTEGEVAQPLPPTPLEGGNNRGGSPTASPTSQSKKFIEAARDLGCAEDESALDDIVKKVAKAPPPHQDVEKEAAPGRKKKK